MSSSIRDGNEYLYGPQHAFDGVLMTHSDMLNQGWLLQGFYFQSGQEDPHPWVQVDYGCEVMINMVLLTAVYNTDNSNTGTIRNIKIHVGNIVTVTGQLSNNTICAELDGGIIEPNSFKVLTCHQAIPGRYVVIQMHSNNGRTGMALQEVMVFTPISLFNEAGTPSQKLDP